MSILSIFSSKKEIYTTIKKLPISIWWEITENNNFEGLVLSGKYSNIELYNTYLDLLQEYYTSFGTTEKHNAFILAKLNYAKKLAKWISTQKEDDKMFLEMSLIDLQELAKKETHNNENEQSLFDSITVLEKYFGFQLNEDTLTVYKFYSYQKRLITESNNQIEIARKWQRK